MTWKALIILFALGLLVSGLVAQFQTLPGYMDADYYFAGGIQLATGKGFTEPYIWNYLGDPQTLPTPSHSYWMPLASILSALGMWLASSTSYAAGRLPFILLSACVPVLTAQLAFSLARNTRAAWTAGLLAVLSCYYAPFLPAIDNYGIYMLLGGFFLYFLPRLQPWVPFALGALAGLMTLARSDGLLWLGLAGLAVMFKTKEQSRKDIKAWLVTVILGGVVTLAGYFLVMGPWHIRAWRVFGSLMTPGGGKLLWLQNYRDTFIYPASELTREAFLQAGWQVAVQDRFEAFSTNLTTAVFSQGNVFFVPFILFGLWHYRKDLRVRLAVLGWGIVLLVMSFVFPYAGVHGSFHHAGAAFQALFWSAAAIGVDLSLEALRRRGRFTDRFAPFVFHGFLLAFALGFTLYLVNARVVASGWARDDVIYADVEAKLQENGIRPKDVVIVPNPPGYYVRTSRSAIRVPTGDESDLLNVANRFGAAFLILEKSNALGELQDLYDNPYGNPAFLYLGEVAGARLYRVLGVP
jgi:hypothetical protein